MLCYFAHMHIVILWCARLAYYVDIILYYTVLFELWLPS